MQTVTDLDILNDMKTNGALLILFGGASCSVCQSIKPQLSLMIKKQFPDMQSVYIDCEQAAAICAQHSVFTLPVVHAYIEGMQVAEFGRSFSLRQLADAIERPYKMWQQN